MSQIKQEYEEQTFNNSSDIDDAKDAGFGKLPVVNSGVNMKASPSLPCIWGAIFSFVNISAILGWCLVLP